MTLKTFGSLLLRLASVDPTHLLRELSVAGAPAVLPDEQITMPCQLFWHLLRGQVAGNEDADQALSLLKPFFFDKIEKLERAHQQWLLFFALPGALARHTDDAKLSSSNLKPLDCQTSKISATFALEAITEELSFDLTFPIAKDDSSAG